MGGGGIMVWAAIGNYGRSNIKFIATGMNAARYINILEEQLPQYASTIVHTVKLVKQYFRDQNIQVLPWPARSPDLNIIENVWGMFARAVYANGKQFSTVDELKASVEEQWMKINQKEIKKLYKSVPQRLIET